jgi:hypothetical protein
MRVSRPAWTTAKQRMNAHSKRKADLLNQRQRHTVVPPARCGGVRVAKIMEAADFHIRSCQAHAKNCSPQNMNGSEVQTTETIICEDKEASWSVKMTD